MTATEEQTYRIGEVAEQVGVTPRTIRYYEEIGLLAGREQRSKGAHRHYTDADIARLNEVIRLRDLLGLSLDEMLALVEAEDARAALRDRWHNDPGDDERARILDRAIEIVRQQISLVDSRRRKLDEFAVELNQRLRRLQRRRRELEE